MSSQSIFGSFPVQQSNIGNAPSFVLSDTVFSIAANPGQRTKGATRVVEITNKPTLLEKWSIIGWTVQLRIGLIVGQLPVYGMIGDLWAGMLINNPQNNNGGVVVTNAVPLWQTRVEALSSNIFATIPPPSLPTDLSTFSKAFQGSSDFIALLPGTATVDVSESDCTLIGTTYPFSLPISVRNADRLQFGLILTPSIIGGAADVHALTNQVEFIIKTASFSVLYDDGN